MLPTTDAATPFYSILVNQASSGISFFTPWKNISQMSGSKQNMAKPSSKMSFQMQWWL